MCATLFGGKTGSFVGSGTFLVGNNANAARFSAKDWVSEGFGGRAELGIGVRRYSVRRNRRYFKKNVVAGLLAQRAYFELIVNVVYFSPNGRLTGGWKNFEIILNEVVLRPSEN